MTNLRDGYQLPPLKVPQILLPVIMKYFVQYRRFDGLTQQLEHTVRISDTSLQEFSFREPNE